MPTLPATAKHVYSTATWRVMASWIGLAAFGLMALAITIGIGFKRDEMVYIPAAWVGPAALYWFVCRDRIEVSAAGFGARVRGRWVFTEWSNLVAVRVGVNYTGLETKFTVKSPGSFRSAGYGGAVRDLIKQRRYIPLDQYRWNFFHGDFVETVEQFAPHVALRSVLEAKYPNIWKHGRWTPVE